MSYSQYGGTFAVGTSYGERLLAERCFGSALRRGRVVGVCAAGISLFLRSIPSRETARGLQFLALESHGHAARGVSCRGTFMRRGGRHGSLDVAAEDAAIYRRGGNVYPGSGI